MTEIKAGMRVVDPGGYGLDGRVVEIVGDRALVAYDGGERPSDWIPIAVLRPKVGRPKGSGVRRPAPPPKGRRARRRIAEVMRQEMKKQSLTWDVLASRSGVSRATIARIMRDDADDPRLDIIEALAAALGVSPKDFWDD